MVFVKRQKKSPHQHWKGEIFFFTQNAQNTQKPIGGGFLSRRIRRIRRTCRMRFFSHAEIAEACRMPYLHRFALHKILRFLREIIPYSTTTFRVVSSNFMNQTPRGRSMVSVSVISRVRMVCPSVFVMVRRPVPSIVTRPVVGFG